MSRRLLVAAALFALVVPVATASAPQPARVQISADEFSLALSRPSIRRGPAIIELVNYGEDDHDLALRRLGAKRVFRIGIVRPGSTGSLEKRLPPGRFRLWCTLADHSARGMKATLRVR